MFKLLSLIITMVFIVIGVTLGVLNPQAVQLDLYLINLELPLSVIMAALFISGMLIGAFFIFLQVLTLRWAVRRKTKENQKLSDQIIQLKKTSVQAKEKLTKSSNALVSIEK